MSQTLNAAVSVVGIDISGSDFRALAAALRAVRIDGTALNVIQLPKLGL
jgi:hypothetical protein